MQQASTVDEELPRNDSGGPPRWDFSVQRLRDIERISDAAQAQVESSRRPVVLTTEEVYAMVCQYRYNIRAHRRENESLRNTLATLWMEKYEVR
jgi:hypothetical protein